jgi:hypothetical protein
VGAGGIFGRGILTRHKSRIPVLTTMGNSDVYWISVGVVDRES